MECEVKNESGSTVLKYYKIKINCVWFNYAANRLDGSCFLPAWDVLKYAFVVIHKETEIKAAETERYLTIQLLSRGLLIGKHAFQDGEMHEKTAFFRIHCQKVSKAYYFPAKPHCKQNKISSLSFIPV